MSRPNDGNHKDAAPNPGKAADDVRHRAEEGDPESRPSEHAHPSNVTVGSINGPYMRLMLPPLTSGRVPFQPAHRPSRGEREMAMRTTLGTIGGTILASLLLVTSVAAADPPKSPSPSASPSASTVPAILGLSQAEIRDMRHAGLSLAQIAARQTVDVEKLVDALVARWQERIDVRVANGALTNDQAATLRAQLETRATAMVSSSAPGGMQGAAVGAGPHNGTGTRARDGSGTGNGGVPRGSGTGICDGTGPHGAGRR